MEELAGRELAARRATVARARGHVAGGGTPRATVVSVLDAKPRGIGRRTVAGSALALAVAVAVAAGGLLDARPPRARGHHGGAAARPGGPSSASSTEVRPPEPVLSAAAPSGAARRHRAASLRRPRSPRLRG